MRLLTLAFCSLLLLAGNARPADIRVFSGGAPQAALRLLAPEFERTSGHRLDLTFRLVTEIQQKLSAGEKADVILLPIPLIAATEKSLPFLMGSRMVLARVGIGVIVRQGADLPDISSAESVRNLLLAAKGIALSDPGTPTGGHIDRVLEEVGLAGAVRPKVTTRAAIQGGADLVAKGEADIGLYLVSEVQAAKGVTLVGLLPAPFQSFVVYGAAVPAGSAAPEAALAFIKFISDTTNAARWRAAGFELARE